jgi:hypothetical protein
MPREGSFLREQAPEAKLIYFDPDALNGIRQLPNAAAANHTAAQLRLP